MMMGEHKGSSQIPIDTVLETKRTRLRYPLSSDAAQFLSAIQSPQFPDQLPLKELQTVAEVETWIKRLQTNWQQARVFSWVVEQQDTVHLLGQVSISKKEDPGVWALAFWTCPESWGQGYAPEAAARVMSFAFEELAAGKIWAGAGTWNEASCRVLEKLGMTCVGLNRQGHTVRGQTIETWEYEITNKEFKRYTYARQKNNNES